MGKHEKAPTGRKVQADDPAWQQFRMPAHYFDGTKPETDGVANDETAACTPVVAFINAGSGGHVGEKLAELLRTALGPAQTFEVGKDCNPEAVLKKLWANFERASQEGDKNAARYRTNLRLIAGGGDGTIAWVLNSVRKLGLNPCPPAAVIPLGTGNGLSINFGWGKTIRPEWIMSNAKLLEELKGVVGAEKRAIDIWSADFEAPNEGFYSKDDIPAALSVSPASASANGTHAGEEGEAPAATPPRESTAAEMAGEFCYYLTLGLDAEAAYRFDHLRKEKPHLTQKRKVNIFWYMWYIIRTGWFCGASPLNEKLADLQIKDKDGKWQDVKINNAIRALIIINLQTYSGGRDVWGLKDERPAEGEERGFVPPIFDDGLLEVVGLEGGFWSWAALSGVWKNLHGRRVAQAAEIRIVYHSPKEAKGVAMRMDGEPWWQNLPDKEGEVIKLHIKRKGQATMLLNTASLPGATKKLLAIAQREKTFSRPSE